MTTSELIDLLQKYPGDTPVSVGSNGWGDPALVVTVPYSGKDGPMYEGETEVVPVLKAQRATL